MAQDSVAAPSARARWLALYTLCTGTLMIVLDTTVVTVALPSIQTSLGFTETTLVWVLNAYMLTFGGFLLLGGRLGDLYGNRRLFLLGIVGFTLASLACGIAGAQWLLVAARALQGVTGAVVTAVALSLIMNLFTDAGERAKAMGVYGFVCAVGGSLGEILGGALTQAFSWHAVFLINLPIGLAVYGLCRRLLPADRVADSRPRLDYGGAALVTLGLMLAVYAVIDGNAAGWGSLQTLGLLGGGVACLVAFLVLESTVREPLMPLHLLRLRNLSTANLVGVLWAAGMFAWFVITALYLQRVLGYEPLYVGLAFMPADLVMAAFSLGLSARLVMRFGLRLPTGLGLAIAAVGLVLISRAPLQGEYAVHVLPGMLLLGLGAGMAFNPLLLAAMSEVDESQSGLASGIANTAFMMGGALGLAVLASLADGATRDALAGGAAERVALHQGYRLAFGIGAVMVAVGAVIAGWRLRNLAPPGDAPAAAA